MNDFLAHNSNVQSFRAEMAGKTVLETKASSDARSGSGETAATIVRGTAPADDADVEQRLTSVAAMAEAQAKVAALLAELHAVREIGRASCRERVCQYVWNLGVAGAFKKK